MSLFRALLFFFKKWFLPLPAHDELFTENESSDTETAPATSAEPDVKEISASPVATAQMPIPADYDPENKDLSAVDISPFVKPPENAEERASRGAPLPDETPVE